MDWQEKMIEEMENILKGLYYEDFIFFYKFLVGYGERKGITGEKHDPQERNG